VNYEPAQFERLRELVADISNANAVAAVLRLRGRREAEQARQAEQDTQDSWLAFDLEVTRLFSQKEPK
jgi:hypothetical protein